MRRLLPLLPTLYLAWDQKLFEQGLATIAPQAGGDGGVARAAEQRRQRHNQQDEQSGFARWQPAIITSALRSSFFGHYCSMLLMVEEIPVKLASWAESCPCHGDLAKRVTPYFFSSVLRSHFGSETACCPMAGKRAPELASGKLAVVAAEIWDSHEAALRTIPLYAAALSEKERGMLYEDFWLCKKLVMALLEIKTKFWTLLPWAICGFTASEEGEARKVAQGILR